MANLIYNIRIIRKRKGISQESIAYDLGIDYSTYGKIERGQISLTVDRLEKIARILGVSIEELLKNNEDSGITDQSKSFYEVEDLKMKLSNSQMELDVLKRQMVLLQEQLKDKEKIIELLEHKLN